MTDPEPRSVSVPLNATYIMAVPPRMPTVNILLAELAEPVRVHLDAAMTRNPWSQLSVVLERASHDDTAWTIVLQDDVKLAAHFSEVAGAALGALPANAPVANLYADLKRQPSLRNARDLPRWVAFADHVPGPGFAIRTRAIDTLLTWTREHVPEGYTHSDHVVSEWLASSGQHAYAMLPSLVDHLDGPSMLLVARFGARKATRFAGTKDLRGLDWTVPPGVKVLRYRRDLRHPVWPGAALPDNPRRQGRRR